MLPKMLCLSKKKLLTCGEDLASKKLDFWLLYQIMFKKMRALSSLGLQGFSKGKDL